MKLTYLLAVLSVVGVQAWAVGPPATTPTMPTGCHASLSLADARTLAAATPNARAFAENYGATLQTTVSAQSAGTANVAVTALDTQHGPTDVGIYTVSLRTGHVTDDDMEPAEDAQTSAVRAKLLARHCSAK